jgi:hypothetical protein
MAVNFARLPDLLRLGRPDRLLARTCWLKQARPCIASDAASADCTRVLIAGAVVPGDRYCRPCLSTIQLARIAWPSTCGLALPRRRHAKRRCASLSNGIRHSPPGRAPCGRPQSELPSSLGCRGWTCIARVATPAAPLISERSIVIPWPRSEPWYSGCVAPGARARRRCRSSPGFTHSRPQQIGARRSDVAQAATISAEIVGHLPGAAPPGQVDRYRRGRRCRHRDQGRRQVVRHFAPFV